MVLKRFQVEAIIVILAISVMIIAVDVIKWPI